MCLQGLVIKHLPSKGSQKEEGKGPRQRRGGRGGQKGRRDALIGGENLQRARVIKRRKEKGLPPEEKSRLGDAGEIARRGLAS